MSGPSIIDPGLCGGTLVIIDDSASACAYLSDLVESNIAGCRAITFADSEKALAYLAESDVDLVVLDYMMPPPNGLEFIQRFRRFPDKEMVPIIMVTSQNFLEVRYQALQLGATDFLGKPVDPIEFVTRTRNLLALSRSQKALEHRADWLAEEVRRATRSIVEREREAILFLSRAAEHKDPETAAHLKRMARYSLLIASKLGWNEEQKELLFAAAPMHDIGKIGIPDQILLKPGRLTEEEIVKMRRHTMFGWEILEGSQSPLLQMAAEIALSHHERFDGQGYPQGLSGDAIPMVGRVVALADVFDALTTTRPYKKPWTVAEARAYMVEQEGRHFDPDCVQAMFSGWDHVLEIIKDEETDLIGCPQ